jgi:hypothetical protein
VTVASAKHPLFHHLLDRKQDTGALFRLIYSLPLFSSLQISRKSHGNAAVPFNALEPDFCTTQRFHLAKHNCLAMQICHLLASMIAYTVWSGEYVLCDE